MQHENMQLRDPVMYRIRHEHHHRTGDSWCIYPTYDWAHGQSDAIEGVTHSLCTLEFDSHRALYDWYLDHLPLPGDQPRQTEFARLELTHTVTSKRRLLQLVNDGVVDGWDDPRLPTLRALRRRGYPASAIREFCTFIGVAKTNSRHAIELLESFIRSELNRTAQRRMAVLRPVKVARVLLAAVARRRALSGCDHRRRGGCGHPRGRRRARGRAARVPRRRVVVGDPHVPQGAHAMTVTEARPALRPRSMALQWLVPGGIGRGSWRVVERDAVAYRRQWYVFITGFIEPALFLLSIGIGVGGLVGKVPGPGGELVSYKEFVAPGLMAAAAMNGAVFDTTFNFFFKYKYAHTFDAMLATPLGVSDIAVGETTWALLRGGFYSTVFLLTMWLFGLVASPWALLAIPGALLIGFAFAGAGMAGTTYMRSWLDFDFVNLAIIPMFLFSATFFPVTQYPPVVEAVVRFTPLYQGVVLERALVLGEVSWFLLVHAAYLFAMGAVALAIAARRLSTLLEP